jgi:cytoskeleton protein RodZ
MSEETKASVGELLKQGRLKQRLSIAECAKRTHISPRYLEALEEERWDALPSESHRLGFLRLYSRFLGVPAEELLVLYRSDKKEPIPEAPSTPARAAGPSASASARWTPGTLPQIILLGVIVLGVAWFVYHAIDKQLPSSIGERVTWRRERPEQPRLVAPKQSSTVQKIRVHAEADSWLRVTENNELLFEGILPGGATKEWSGNGPFNMRLGNVRAISIFWNDQPVDILTGARNGMNTLTLPLAPAKGG